MRRMIYCFIVSAIFTLGLPLQSHAGVFISPDPWLPPGSINKPGPPAEYRKDFVILPVITLPDGSTVQLTLRDIKHDQFFVEDISTIGPDEQETFLSRLMFTIDDGMGNMDMFILEGETVVLAFDKAGNTTGTFDTEIISMDLTGTGNLGLLGAEVMLTLTEDPNQASTGVTSILDFPAGSGPCPVGPCFKFDSFFDVFFELEISDMAGNPLPITPNPIPGDGRVVLQNNIPEPATWALFIVGLGMLSWLHRRKRAA